MIESYINEYHEGPKYYGDNDNMRAAYADFFSNQTPFLVDSINYKVWCDESKEVGLDFSDGSGNIKVVNKSPDYLIIKHNKIYRSTMSLYIQRSIDGNVWYFRDETSAYSSNNNPSASIIFAKDTNGWVIFSADKMTTTLHHTNITTDTLTNDSALYMIQKMSNSDNKTFLELYKVLFAGNFTKSSTVISRNNTLYRVVSVNNDSSKPSFAFPVSENFYNGEE